MDGKPNKIGPCVKWYFLLDFTYSTKIFVNTSFSEPKYCKFYTIGKGFKDKIWYENCVSYYPRKIT